MVNINVKWTEVWYKTPDGFEGKLSGPARNRENMKSAIEELGYEVVRVETYDRHISK